MEPNGHYYTFFHFSFFLSYPSNYLRFLATLSKSKIYYVVSFTLFFSLLAFSEYFVLISFGWLLYALAPPLRFFLQVRINK